MAQYTSKFSPRDTAYLVDLVSLLITPVTVSEVFIKDTLSAKVTPVVMYKVKSQEKYGVGKELNETELYTLDEAKALITPALQNRTTSLQQLV